MNSVIDRLYKELDEKVIEGLKRKGFKFKNEIELHAFIQKRCRCQDNIELKQKVYYVDDIPFLLHDYKIGIPKIPSTTHVKNKITVSLGTYSYL
jgi:hypothetical protein